MPELYKVWDSGSGSSQIEIKRRRNARACVCGLLEKKEKWEKRTNRYFWKLWRKRVNYGWNSGPVGHTRTKRRGKWSLQASRGTSGNDCTRDREILARESLTNRRESWRTRKQEKRERGKNVADRVMSRTNRLDRVVRFGNSPMTLAQVSVAQSRPQIPGNFSQTESPAAILVPIEKNYI